MNTEGELPATTRQRRRGRYPTSSSRRNSHDHWSKSSPIEGAGVGRSPVEEAQAANAEVARTSSLGWQTLALAFRGATEEWVKDLMDGSVTAALSEATRWVGSDRELFAGALEMSREFMVEQQSRDIRDVLRDIKVEYDHLFIGVPGRLEAPPYESAYLEREAAGEATVRGPTTLAVEKVYRRHGMKPSFAQANKPDHVAAELEFMYFLSRWEGEAWEEGEAEMAKEFRRAQLGFLEEHLAHWVPDFCGRVQNATQSDLYFALAGILREFLTVETCTAYGGRVP